MSRGEFDIEADRQQNKSLRAWRKQKGEKVEEPPTPSTEAAGTPRSSESSMPSTPTATPPSQEAGWVRPLWKGLKSELQREAELLAQGRVHLDKAKEQELQAQEHQQESEAKGDTDVDMLHGAGAGQEDLHQAAAETLQETNLFSEPVPLAPGSSPMVVESSPVDDAGGQATSQNSQLFSPADEIPNFPEEPEHFPEEPEPILSPANSTGTTGTERLTQMLEGILEDEFEEEAHGQKFLEHVEKAAEAAAKQQGASDAATKQANSDKYEANMRARKAKSQSFVEKLGACLEGGEVPSRGAIGNRFRSYLANDGEATAKYEKLGSLADPEFRKREFRMNWAKMEYKEQTVSAEHVEGFSAISEDFGVYCSVEKILFEEGGGKPTRGTYKAVANYVKNAIHLGGAMLRFNELTERTDIFYVRVQKREQFLESWKKITKGEPITSALPAAPAAKSSSAAGFMCVSKNKITI